MLHGGGPLPARHGTRIGAAAATPAAAAPDLPTAAPAPLIPLPPLPPPGAGPAAQAEVPLIPEADSLLLVGLGLAALGGGR